MTACAVKVRWFTRRDAQRARRHTPGEHLRAYRCPLCRCWHLGHLPQAVLHGLASADRVYRRRPAVDDGWWLR